MGSRTVITETNYDEVKKLIEHGLKYEQISKYCDVSFQTISRIKKSTDLDDYKRITRDAGDYRAKQATDDENDGPVIKQIEPQAFWYNMNRIYEEMKKQTALLERIVAVWKA